MRPELIDGAARRTREARLEAVARSFVRDKPVHSCGILVSCADDPSKTTVVVQALADAAKGMSLTHAAVGEPTTPARNPRLWSVSAGGVTESWLAHLDPPRSTCVDLLLWWGDPRRHAFVREAYLLGMVAWSLRPRKTIVFLDGDDEARKGMRGVLEPLALDAMEVLSAPAAGRLVPLLQQVLSSALSAGSRRARSL